MRIFILTILLLCNTSFAEVGKVLKIVGDADAFLLRENAELKLSEGLELNEGDRIHTQSSVILLHLYPQSQLSLAKHTEIILTKNVVEEDVEKEKTSSIIEYIKGLIRIQVTKDMNQEIDQKVQADGVAFAVRGTEFEVSQDNGDIELDVIEGEVEVTSPFVQTFVPEIVKPNEGFRFKKKQKQFARKKFALKFKNHPAFLNRENLKEKWKQVKAKRKLKSKVRGKQVKHKGSRFSDKARRRNRPKR